MLLFAAYTICMNYDRENEMFNIAVDLVTQSSRSIFLTGKAGTGKTTFLKYLKSSSLKQMAIVAPTGVAAINAGGVTIHFFFQLPLSPFIPATGGFSQSAAESVNKTELLHRLKFDREKLRVLRGLELLVIDEISMVRCDMMDAIDVVLRYVRRQPSLPFGGVQLLLIGDMFQLPPVIRDQEWKLLAEHYNSPYFFDSLVIREFAPLYIEFDRIYRQSEERFIRVLNQVRHNELDEDGMKILQDRYRPVISHTEGYITLTTHNESAKRINSGRLEGLGGKAYSFFAEVEGEFANNSFPAEEELKLKVGAQVMFIRNDSDRGRRFYNGKIGVVKELGKDLIKVQCPDDDTPIEVKKEKWENVRYAVEKNSMKLEENLLGSFVQYPLRLAWAITIHKSQGLTFEKAIIDAGHSFAAGQVYVALSRCTSLDGLILQSEIRPGTILSDPRIVEFSQRSSSSTHLKEELAIARRQYLENLLLSTFDFDLALQPAKELKRQVQGSPRNFNEPAATWITGFSNALVALQEVALRFQSWLRAEFGQPGSPEDNIALQDRLEKAAIHFGKELDTLIGRLQSCPIITDSVGEAKEFNESIRSLFAEITWKRHLFHGWVRPFTPSYWQLSRKSFVVPALLFNVYSARSRASSESPHPELFNQLKFLRDSICDRLDVPVFMVASTAAIQEMVRYLPHTAVDLRRIKGFGATRVRQYGDEFLEIINEYCDSHGLQSLMHEFPSDSKKTDRVPKKDGRPNTREESYNLFRTGMPLEAIAGARNLSRSTIEGHLSSYVASGHINVSELLPANKVELIENAIRDSPDHSLAAIKRRLGALADFSEIRIAMAWLQFKGADGVADADQ